MQRRNHSSRHPWNDANTWRQTLQKLPALEIFMLWTLTSIATSSQSEARVINSWVKGPLASNSRLRAIVLIPYYLDSARRMTNFWVKQSSNEWKLVRTEPLPDPEATKLLIEIL